MGGVNPSDLTKDELLSRFLQLQQRVEKLNQETDRKDEKIELLKGLVQQQDEQIELQKELVQQKDEEIRLLEAHQSTGD